MPDDAVNTPYDGLYILLSQVEAACAHIQECLDTVKEDFPDSDWESLKLRIDDFAYVLESFVIPDEESFEDDSLHNALYEAVSSVIEQATGKKRSFNLMVELLPTQLH